ncbi:MAG TPA: cation:proton antiporter, partial [Thermoanaerobaculia bacterium]|nr:cation:proton antiporter [Thermoanaerobaculia bacterium]
EHLTEAVVLGVTFLLFVVGIELNFDRVRRQRRAALWVGLWQFLFLGAAGWAAGRALGFSTEASLYLGLALSASSTLVVVQLLQGRQQLFEPFGRLVVGVLLVQDLLVVLLIPVLGRLADGVGAIAVGVGAVGLLLAVTWVCQRWLLPWGLLRIQDDDETLLILMLAGLFAFLALAHLLDLPLVAGAFLAGLAFSRFPVSGVIRAQLRSISDFFLAVLFTALGGLVGVPSLQAVTDALVLAAVVVVVTPPLVTFIAERYGLATRSAIEGGLLLAQTSELSLVVGIQALVQGQVGERTFSSIVLVTAVTMLLTPLLATDRVTRVLMRLHPLRHRPRPERPARGHVLLLGCGESGMLLLETLLVFGHDVLVIDDDAVVIGQVQEAGVPALRGDASDPELLDAAGVRHASIIVSTLRRVADNEVFLRHAPGVPALVRVFDHAEAARIRELGGRPVVLAEATAEDLLLELDREGLLGPPSAAS